MKAITEIDGDTAVVHPVTAAERGQLAAHLLTAAGPGNARTVRTISVRGGGRAFQVPLAVAYAASLIPIEADDTSGNGDAIVRDTSVPERVLSAQETASFVRWTESETGAGAFLTAHQTEPEAAAEEMTSSELDSVAEATDLGDAEAEQTATNGDDRTAPAADSQPATAKKVPAKKVPAKKAPAKKAAPKAQETKTHVE